jgi:hypothetical protein
MKGWVSANGGSAARGRARNRVKIARFMQKTQKLRDLPDPSTCTKDENPNSVGGFSEAPGIEDGAGVGPKAIVH